MSRGPNPDIPVGFMPGCHRRGPNVGETVPDPAEIAFLAKSNAPLLLEECATLGISDARYTALATALRHANPALKHLGYYALHEGEFSQAGYADIYACADGAADCRIPACAGAPAVCEGFFVHRGAGTSKADRFSYGGGKVLMDITNPLYRQWVVPRVAERLIANGMGGFLADGVWAQIPGVDMSPIPAVIRDNWGAAWVDFIKEIKAAVGPDRVVIANTSWDAPSYLDFMSALLAPGGADGIMMEDPFGKVGEDLGRIDRFPQINLALDRVDAAGKFALFAVNTPTESVRLQGFAGTDLASQQRFARYYLSAFLNVFRGPKHILVYSVPTPDVYQFNSQAFFADWNLRVGAPVDSVRTVAPRVFMRPFQNAQVFVNHGLDPYEIDFGAGNTLVTAEGVRVSRYTLPPHSGMLFVGGNVLETGNPSFENVWNWQPNAPGGVSVETSPAVVRSGAHSLRLNGGVDNPGVHQPYDFAPHTTYVWAGWVRTENNANPSLIAALAPAGATTPHKAAPSGGGVFIHDDVLPRGTAPWRRVQMTFTTGAQGGAGNFYAAMNGFALGNVWFDDVGLFPAQPGDDIAPPSVSLTAPAAGARAAGAVTLSAQAADDRALVGVQFRVDGVDVGAEATAAPYAVVWDSRGAGDGAKTVTAAARDLAGNVTFSAPVTIAVDNTPPAVAIAQPGNGATVSGQISVTGAASDGGGLASVRIGVGSPYTFPAAGLASWTFPIDTRALPNGSHTITARAVDAAGNAQTASVTVTVNNPPSAPMDGTFRLQPEKSAHEKYFYNHWGESWSLSRGPNPDIPVAYMPGCHRYGPYETQPGLDPSPDEIAFLGKSNSPLLIEECATIGMNSARLRARADAIHAANPNQKYLGYYAPTMPDFVQAGYAPIYLCAEDPARCGGAQMPACPTQSDCEAFYLHHATGPITKANRVITSFGTSIMNLANPHYRQWTAAQVAQQIRANNMDGVLMDSVWPIIHGTDPSNVPANWEDAWADFFRDVKAALGTGVVMANAPWGGYPDFVAKITAPGRADGIMMEDALGRVDDDMNRPDRLPMLARTLDALGNRIAFFNVNSPRADINYFNTSPADQQRYARYYLTLFLNIFRGPNHVLNHSVPTPTSYQYHSDAFFYDWNLRVGQPLGPMEEIAPRVYHRKFQNAFVYTNNGDSPHLIDFGAGNSLVTADGLRVNQYTLAPKSGMLFVGGSALEERNPSFENPWNWRPNAAGGFRVETTPAHVRTGLQSLRVEGDNSPGLAQNFDVAPNTTYVWSAWVKTENNGRASTVAASLPAAGLVTRHKAAVSGAGAFVNDDILPRGTAPWRRLQMVFTSGPSGGVGTYYAVVNGTSQGAVWFDDVNLYPAGAGDDLAPPTVTVAPAAGPVGGALTATAEAADNVGVAGVQFFLDGAPLGDEDTAAPFAAAWDSRAFPDGPHTLTAQARDAAGNVAVSAPAAVTVDNTAPVFADVTVAMIGVSSATLSWTTHEPADTQIDYGITTAYGMPSPLDAALVTNHAMTTFTGLAPGTLYHIRARSRDAAGNLGLSQNLSFTTRPAPRVGDFNGDGAVDVYDLGFLLVRFNTADVTADIFVDGVVDVRDLGRLLNNWGS